MNSGIYLLRHPQKGMIARLDFEGSDKNLKLVRNQVSELYPGVCLQNTWTLNAWWLMEYEERPFFVPKPWPFAMVYLQEKMEEYLGEVPNWLILSAPASDHFNHWKASNKVEAYQMVMSIIGPHGGVAEETEGGYTFKWTSPENEELVVAYAVRLSTT